MIIKDKRTLWQVFQFSQADVDQGKILFRHQGIAHSRIALRISDGQLHTTATLEVLASDAFLQRVNRSDVIVRSPPKTRSTTLISIQHIGIDSNLDFSPQELVFEIVEAPELGSILVDGTALKPDPSAVGFRMSDLMRGGVAYRAAEGLNGTVATRDNLKFRASVRKIVLEGQLDIRILPESYWDPLKVVDLRSVTVEESTSVTIDRTSLRVSQLGVDVKDIVYIVHQPPLHGYLEVDHDGVDYDDDPAVVVAHRPEVNVFDQSVIDENRLHYIQSGANQTLDRFVFDVTNGVVTLTNLTFDISIIPKSIFLATRCQSATLP